MSNVEETLIKEDENLEVDVYICENCGGNMLFDIKSQKLKCPNCDTEQDIISNKDIKEYDFHEYDLLEKKSTWGNEVDSITCSSCGGEAVVEKNQTAVSCSFCGSSQILKSKQEAGITPEGVLPFKIDKHMAQESLEKWMKKRWLSPNNLKVLYETETLKSIYIPYWTYDANTVSNYSGQGGKYYYVTEERNGKNVRVRKTNWHNVSGIVHEDFDDVLVNASRNFQESLMKTIEPYDTAAVETYKPHFLSGYIAERYSKGMKECFIIAKSKMNKIITNKATKDILRRYDTSRGVTVRTVYNNLTYKHVLLPVWTANYDYGGKKFVYVINGQTGKINGKYPYSPVKIAILIVIAVILIGCYMYFSN